MRKNKGFTLIELMIVIVIVAVLLAVALPAYQDSVIKSNRSAGRGILLDVASRQEQYFINNKMSCIDWACQPLDVTFETISNHRLHIKRVRMVLQTRGVNQ